MSIIHGDDKVVRWYFLVRLEPVFELSKSLYYVAFRFQES